MTVQKKILDLTGSQYLVQKVKSAINDVDSSLSTHIADTDIHVTIADKNKWNNQTYVFRYSSTVLTPSSTNSNALLDNTDNLKVGDKVIDSSGVLFSITAIDTANNTFTIGTALIDLAQDSDVVHKSGNETIAGEKTFNDLHIIGYGTQYKGSRNAYILPEFAAGYSGLSITTLGISQAVKIGNFVLDANNKPSLDTSKGYIQIATGENNGVNACVLEPRNSTSSSLGASANRWSKIYGTEYYYGSNNVEFSTKFVTTDTAQTIAGAKTFSDNPVIGNNNTNITISNRQITANGYSSAPTGSSYSFMQLKAIVNYADSSPSIDATVVLSIQENAYSDGKRAGFNPNSNNTINLGLAGKRWANVYATNYYYGGSEIEFSQKFVTTDTAQTISGNKTFSSDLYVANTDTTANTPNLTLRNYKVDRGTTDTGVQTITFLDKNAKALTLIESRKISNGNVGTNILCYNTDDSNNTVSGGVSIIKSKTDTNFAPNADNAVTCGRPLAKWSDVQTYKVNNLEPSSLSLPSDRSARIDISSYFTNTGTGNTNDYSVPANGFIFLNLLNAFAVICYSIDGTNNVNYAQSYFRPVDGQIYILFPVRKNDTFRTLWTANGGTITVTGAHFIPCLGNV